MKTYEIEPNIITAIPIEKYKALRPKSSNMNPPYCLANRIMTIDGTLSTLSVAKYPSSYELNFLSDSYWGDYFGKKINSENSWADPHRLDTVFENVPSFKYDCFEVDKSFREEYRAKIKEIKAYEKNKCVIDTLLKIGSQYFPHNSLHQSFSAIDAIVKLSTTPQTTTKVYIGQQTYREEPRESILGGTYLHRVACFDMVEVYNKEGDLILFGVFCSAALIDKPESNFKMSAQPIQRGVSVDWRANFDAIDNYKFSK